MEDFGGVAWNQSVLPNAPPRRRRRWLLMGGLALAFALTLGVGALVGSTIGGARAGAAGFVPGFANGPQTLVYGSGAQTLPGGPGAQGPCALLTVSSVSGQTIVAKASDGSTVTIHTTSSTQYTRGGQSVAASAVTAGSQIRVVGTRNSDGSITATHVDLGG